MRDRAVALAAAEAQQAAEAAAADASAAQADADQALLDAAAADGKAVAVDGRVDDVLAGVEDFTAISVGGDDKFGFLDTVASDVLPTEGLAANAVTDEDESFDATVLSLSGTTPVTHASVAVVTNGEPVDLSCRFLLEVSNPTAFGMVLRIWRDDGASAFVIFQEVVGNLAFKDAGDNYRFGQPYTAEWTDQPAAGSYTYFFETEFTINTGFTTQQTSNRYIKALRRRR
jgi:hypothetical protein